mgnify:CR=1 FL=1
MLEFTATRFAEAFFLLLPFGLAESFFESFAGEMKVAVFLHVRIDELPGAVELLEAFLNGGERAFFIEEINLGKDGRNFHREIGALRFGEESEFFL